MARRMRGTAAGARLLRERPDITPRRRDRAALSRLPEGSLGRASIPDHGSADFAPADSIFWGQTGQRLTQNNLTITYSCFQQKDPGSDSWSAVLSAAGAAAGSLAGAGPYGWAFGLGDVALQTVAAAVAAAQQQGDWHMFDVTQTIDKSWLLELTNGHVWSFTQGGGDSAFHYPWSLTVYVESWGCADAKHGPTP